MIEYVAPDTFRNAKNLQVLNLRQNDLTELSHDTFRTLGNLRIVDISYNLLRTLPDNLFTGDDLERLDVSHNQLTKIPVHSLNNVAAMTLSELDLSHNIIGAIHSNDLSNKFRVSFSLHFIHMHASHPSDGTVTITLSSQRLAKLDLSHNRLVRLEDAAFATLPNLMSLDLSGNVELEVYGRVFIGLESSLLKLSLDNISLIQVPDLALPYLRVLRLSNNGLPSIPTELAANLTSLRDLDVSHNDLTTVPLITHSLENLRSFSLAGNPISSLSNTSLLGIADTLEYLDIAHLELMSVEVS